MEKDIARPQQGGFWLIEKWLRGRVHREAFIELLGGAIFLVLGLVVLAVTLYCAGLILFLLLLHHGNAFSPGGLHVKVMRPIFLIPFFLILVVVLLAGAWRRRGEMDYSQSWNLYAPGRFLPTFTNAACEFLFAGPSLLINACESLADFSRLMRMDFAQVARVLLWMFDRGKKSRGEEIFRALPGLNTVRVLPQLRDVPGVIWLLDSRGVILLSEQLRNELAEALGRTAEEPAVEDGPADWKTGPMEETPFVSEEIRSWYATLNLPPLAPIQQVKKKYRQLAKLHHPDARLRNDGRGGSDEKIKQINLAYHNIIALAREQSAAA